MARLSSCARATCLFYACVAPVVNTTRLQHQHRLFKNWYPWQHLMAWGLRAERHRKREGRDLAEEERKRKKRELVAQMMPSSSVVAGGVRQTRTVMSLSLDTGWSTTQHRLACWARACCHAKGDSEGRLRLRSSLALFSSILVPLINLIPTILNLCYIQGGIERPAKSCAWTTVGIIISQIPVWIIYKIYKLVSWIWSYIV